MRNNGVMSEPSLAPRSALGGVIVVWVAALLAGIGIGVFVPEVWRAQWLLVGFGGAALLSFAVQLWYGQTRGFIFRIGLSIVGALLILGVVSVGFGLAALIPS